MTDRPHFLDTARYALEKHYPGYACAFVAGSMLRGQDTAKSDIDIVVLFDDAFEDIHRNSVIEQGWPIEFFVQNPLAQDYFFEKDRQRGMCILMTMVATGVVLPEASALSDARKTLARQIIEAGPPALSEDDARFRRYVLTDLLDDLVPGQAKLEQYGVLSQLYNNLGDFYLRAGGRWSGQGKALGRLLRENCPKLATAYERAFEAAFEGNYDALHAIADTMLAESGGRFWAGYRHAAPDDWRSDGKEPKP